MLMSRSLYKVNSTGDINETNTAVCVCAENLNRRNNKHTSTRNILEQYHITIKPKVYKSNSLSDLTSEISSAGPLKRAKKHLPINRRNLVFDSCGDTLERFWAEQQADLPYMSWNFKGKKPKKKNQMSSKGYTKKNINEYYSKYQRDISSCADNTSVCSMDDISSQKIATFPFKPTPSGNLKVQTNQVVFQSATVGVLLADPTQAEVKVKFEGNTTDEIEEDNESGPKCPLLQYGAMIEKNNQQINNKKGNKRSKNSKNVNGKDLKTLGYTLNEPIDWLRVQLPKKSDLCQEIFRRLHNFINTDTTIRIGKQEFHCHRIVLQIYSSYFDKNIQNEIELPENIVTAKAFETIYEWMIFNSPESNKFLKRENVLELFFAAQNLLIKDLEDQCWSFIVNESLFNEDTAFVMFREARAKGIAPVVDVMVPRVTKFFLPLVASNDYLNLEVDDVITFLNSNYICVTSEIEVLMAGVRWLRGDWPDRCKYAVDIMRCVRFGLISPWQLVDIKRNPENAEILEIVSDPEIQQMVDDGLAYVIIKYWYGNNSKNYYHWIDVLGLTEPAERNWIGEEKNHVTYKDFLDYLEQFSVPREQMYQQMAMMQPLKRNDDVPGSLRGIDKEKMDMHRQKIDFPLPAALKSLGAKENFPTIPDVLTNKFNVNERSPTASPSRSPPPMRTERENLVFRTNEIYEEPQKDSSEVIVSSNSEVSVSGGTSDSERAKYIAARDRRHSVAASFLAAATAALSNKRESQTTSPRPQLGHPPRLEQNVQESTLNPEKKMQSPDISLFNQSKESLAKMNMNKLSASILGPSNKRYVTEGSLFHWDRETVLVFGGIDPHTPYGMAGNTGRDIYRFDPGTNSWDNVGELPEPRHHHSVAFLRGRVFLVGGADPRQDDLRGKSMVVSTVWSYEPVTKSWYSESGLAIPRKNFGLVVHRMALYVIGGQDKKGRVLRSVEKFDPKTGSWSEVRPMNVGRMAVAAVKYRDYIWVAGGMSGEKKKPVCNVVECYNSKTNEWTEIHNLRFPRCFATLFSMNDKLYIIGGAGKIGEKDKTPSSVSAIDVWDWKTRQWKLETEMSIPRHGHALAYLGTQLIIIGGVTTIYMRALSNVESFCCDRRAWIRGVATLPSPLSGHGAVTLPPASLM